MATSASSLPPPPPTTTTTTTPSSKDECIGISLGITNACCGVWRKDRVEILTNDNGSRTTPCCVAFTTTTDDDDENPLVGDKAKAWAHNHPTMTVSGAQRLIGRTNFPRLVQEERDHLQQWPFSIVAASDGQPAIPIEMQQEQQQRQHKQNNNSSSKKNGEETTTTTTKLMKADEITSIILKRLKDIAEARLGTDEGGAPILVKHAVISVPAHYTDATRQIMKDAAKVAGLDVLRTISEPFAAAIAYGLDKEENTTKQHENSKQDDDDDDDDEVTNVLVFDLGGATCNVSIVAIEEGIFEVVASANDDYLGGDNFDRRMVEYVKAKFFQQHGFHLSADEGSLEAACQRAKHKLSTWTTATIEVDIDDNNTPFKAQVTRSNLEEICGDYFRKCLDLCKQAMKNAKMSSPDQLDKIILAGGSSRIPRVRSILSNFFKKTEICDSIDPIEVVAHGATAQAAMLCGKDDPSVEKLSKLTLFDYVPLSFGVETAGGIMARLIERQMCVPVKKTRTFSTNTDNQTSVTIRVYDGERIFTKDNMLIAKFDLNGIPPMPRGQAKIDVCLEVGLDGIIHASATECSTGTQKKLRIVNDKFRLTQEIIDRMVSEAASHKDQDEARKKEIEQELGLAGQSHPLLLDEESLSS